jgi:hypothetical protein
MYNSVEWRRYPLAGRAEWCRVQIMLFTYGVPWSTIVSVSMEAAHYPPFELCALSARGIVQCTRSK